MIADDRRSPTDAANVWGVGVLCFLVTMFEGFDLQIVGVLAPMIRGDLELAPAELGVVFGAATLGLLLGAIVSGWFADRIGRKPTLVVSIGIFAVCTWMTSLAQTADQLSLVRLLTGVGLGGAMPCIAAIASEAVGRKGHIAFVTIMFAGMPFGGGLSALAIALWPGEVSWRVVFEIGGGAQLALAVLIFSLLSESEQFARRNNQTEKKKEASQAMSSSWRSLSAKHWIAVLGLCVAFFFTLLSLHFFLNWLPTLLSSQGLSGREAAFVSFAFGAAGGFGSILVGWVAQKGRVRLAMLAAYGGVAFASVAPGVFGGGLVGALMLGGIVGFFLVGGQMLLYGLAPAFFPTSIRGSGVGVTIACGRLGSFVGPTVAGVLLGWGWTQREVMALNAPAALLAAGALAIALALAQPAAGE